MNKDTLLDHIHAGRSRWESALTQLSPDQWVGANTYEHYDEHLADLPAWLDR